MALGGYCPCVDKHPPGSAWQRPCVAVIIPSLLPCRHLVPLPSPGLLCPAVVGSLATCLQRGTMRRNVCLGRKGFAFPGPDTEQSVFVSCWKTSGMRSLCKTMYQSLEVLFQSKGKLKAQRLIPVTSVDDGCRGKNYKGLQR